MIANDQQLQTTLERITWFQDQVTHLRKTETNPVNYRASVSGFLAEIDSKSENISASCRQRGQRRPNKRRAGRPQPASGSW
jgi:hypothetical protein